MISSTKQELPPGVIQYASAREVPQDRQKYWAQRRDIFSKFDEGIWMTDNAWFETTSELIAAKIASEIATYAPTEKEHLIDAFCGVGGNTIAFALSGRWKTIWAIEKDDATIKCARHNAQVYGVSKKINFVKSDVMEVLKGRLKTQAKQGVIFASPPWGGPTYSDSNVFDLKQMSPYGLEELYGTLHNASKYLALFLPRNSDLQQIADLAGNDESNPQTARRPLK
ncbi:MAG: hypothetical protein Q9162_003390 [Coniocarpon cinnabarinum]